ncbi:TetR/AcrR family transcriptional regulator [Brevibacillus parabrevis]|uniref:TetR/AcrR family transcriptional regulator n=1 Tax=Brevibacillus parabrevis TaxID=54914 RepID=UPI002380AEF0|nr:TetR/AcrR family transcriptional regulator [Brevibacillus parabrevis]MED2257047.1 TetR/AcrR family transcriptional regulator [Brevibacillus parabrevis]WDV95989.1 TetR/AcrR family transcriptional regulator [Brevibacillus parabrevis]
MSEVNKHTQKSNESYQKIMNAAVKVFAQHGYDKASIDLLAKEAGYTKGTFYLHFKSKEDFFLEFMDHKLSIYKQHFLPLLNSNEPFESVVSQGVHIFYQLSNQDNWIQIFFEFCSIAVRNESVRERMSAYYQEWFQLICLVLEKGKQTKQLPENLDSKIAASAIVAVLDGYNLQNSFVADCRSVEQVERLIKQILGLF